MSSTKGRRAGWYDLIALVLTGVPHSRAIHRKLLRATYLIDVSRDAQTRSLYLYSFLRNILIRDSTSLLSNLERKIVPNIRERQKYFLQIIPFVNTT